MADFVKNHALQNVWCEPAQDRQYIIKPARLTSDGGAYKNVLVHWEQIPLPNATIADDHDRFHVYQIGQIHPSLINLSEVRNQWRALSGLCEANNLHVNIFLSNGLDIPRSESYIRYTYDNNVLLAVRILNGLSGVNTTQLISNDLYARFYSNAYFDSNRWIDDVVSPDNPIKVIGRFIRDANDYLAFRQQCQAVETAFGVLGNGTYFLDGYVVNKPAAYNAASMAGKFFEFIWDASIKNVYTFDVTSLEGFQSTLDGNNEKLLVYTGKDIDTINYQDDIDVYLVRYTSTTAFKGIYLNRLQEDAVRMLTHSAYSVMEDYLNAIVVQHPDMGNILDCRLVFKVRHGGFKRGLVQQHNRIEELYKLSDAEIVGAMVGVNATVPEWQADELESSAYTRIMRSSADALDDATLEEAYGYNVLTKLFAKSTNGVELNGAVRSVRVGPALNVPHPSDNLARRCVFGYDTAGNMFTHFNNNGHYDLIPIAPVGARNAETAEVLCNLYGTTDGTYFPNYNNALSQFSEAVVATEDLRFHGFRCYVCPMVGGIPNEQWYDVTENLDNYYIYDDSGAVPTLTWNTGLLVTAQLYPCVKINNRVLFYKVPLNEDAYPGFIRFSVNADVRWLGVNQKRVQTVPFGTVEVFMDEASLIENIDYYVNWPQIVIVKKPNRTPLEGLDVRVRCYGFCDPDTMQHYPAREIGFVKGGLLSVDGRYDIRNDRNLRIVVAGALKRREQVRFAEDSTGSLNTDGLPFSISDVITPVEHFTSKDTMAFRKEAMLLDNVVEDYLDVRLAETTPALPIVVGDRWAVYSPFCSGIIHALLEGFLDNGELDTDYNNVDVATWLAPYLYLLDYDPCVLGVDENYIRIIPHQYNTSIQLTQAQYAFMEYVIQHYLNSKVDLTQFVTIGS